MTTEAAVAANANVTPSREFLERQAFEAFKAFVFAFQRLVEVPSVTIEPSATPADSPTKDVMTADEVAVFLGVDRNTVYDFASRGVIPHQRLGKRLLFRRGAVVAWLDTSLCNAASVMLIFAASLIERSPCAIADEELSSSPCSKRSSKGNSI